MSGTEQKSKDTRLTETADLRTHKQLLSGSISRGIQ
nr:MAG TPA: hypothetical protein [Caudoviricetes sp.]